MKPTNLIALLVAIFSLTACGAGVADGSADAVNSTDDLSGSTSPGKFEIFVGADGQYYFHLLAANGEKVLASQGYTSPDGVQGGIDTVKKNGVIASRYQARTAEDGSNYFVLKAGNGHVIGVSEMYSSSSNATRGETTVQNVVKATADVPVAAVTGARFAVFKGLDGKYYFDLHAQNGEIVLQSQGYTTKSGANSGVTSVTSNALNTARYQVRAAADGDYYFVLKASNGRVIGMSEMYGSNSEAQAAINAVVEAVSTVIGK